MRTIRITYLAIALFLGYAANAQTTNEYLIVDSNSVYVHKAQLDSSLLGCDIFSLLQDSRNGGEISISQSINVKNALYNQIQANSSRKIQGYRVRIYFDNGKNARNQSEYIARTFAESYPEQRVYRSHVSPYFKVTVGDFRTKTEAQIFAQSISGRYPSVFLVKEAINYPY